jgi:hypothetical protein
MRGRGDPDRGGAAAPVERVWLREEEERRAEMGERRGMGRVWLGFGYGRRDAAWLCFL